MKTVLLLAVALLPLAFAGSSWMDSSEEKEDGPGQDMMEMMQKLFKEAHEKQHESEKEDKQKEMMKYFEQWRAAQMAKHWEEKEREEQQKREYENLIKKQMMVHKMANLSAKFQEQKHKLVHDVTSQFLEFCSCADTSAMMKKYFQIGGFGKMDYVSEWRQAMAMDFNDDGDDDMVRPSNASSGMGNHNGTSNGNGTSMGGAGEMSEAQRAKFEAKAREFAVMTPEKRAKKLFESMLMALCQRASEFMQHVKQFEQFYVQWREHHA